MLLRAVFERDAPREQHHGRGQQGRQKHRKLREPVGRRLQRGQRARRDLEAVLARDRQHHRHQNADRQQGQLVLGRRRFLDLADQEKVAAAALLVGERGMGLDQQHVAGVQHDVADLLVQPLAVAGHGDDDRVVVAAEPRVADRHADQRAGVADDRLDQAPLRPRGLEVKHVLGRRHQAANPLQLDDRIDDADEQQPVAAPQHFAGRDGGNRVAVAVDLGQEQARQMPQAGAFDRLADQRAALFDLHLDGVFLGVVGRAQRRPPVGQQVAGGEDHVDPADERRRHADPADVEHAQLVLRRRAF